MIGSLVASAIATTVGASPTVTAPPTGEPDPAFAYADEGYALVWADEFNADGAPDPAKWRFEEGFSRNEEAQWYQPDNAWVEGGRLIIEARRERVPNPTHDPASKDWRRARPVAAYTSSSLLTRDLHAWRYGRFEMRGRFDTDPGLWPAWWTVGDQREANRPWPACGEIDMMEYYRGDLLANAAWKKRGGNRWAAAWDSTKTPVESLDRSKEAWSDAFHTWRMDWDEDTITLSVDGHVLNTVNVTEAQNPDGSYAFRWPHIMIVNLAVGGTNGGDPSETEFPRRYEVDWIRVYQRGEP